MSADKPQLPGGEPRLPDDQPCGAEGAVPCHLCGAPAGGRCRQCRRPVCGEDLVRLTGDLQPLFGPDACRECAEHTTGELARGEGQWARKRALDRDQRTCAICGREFEQALPQCSRCGRPLCSQHRLRYRKKFRFGATDAPGEAWYWDQLVRCHRHRLGPVAVRLGGWSRDAEPVPEDTAGDGG